jgi:predicted TIM-barrel fold metal-dependent hydrolase
MTARTGQSGRTSTVADVTTYDADVHLTLPTETIRSHLEEPHKHSASIDYIQEYSGMWDPLLGGKIERRSLTDPDQVRTELCEEFGIDHPILNTIPLLTLLPSRDLAVAVMRAHNDILLEEYLDAHDEFLGVAALASQDPEAAAEELDRLGDEPQIVGAFLMTSGAHPQLGHPDYDAVYEAAADNDLPIVYHAAATSTFEHEFPLHNRGFEQFMPVHTLSHMWSLTATMASLIVNGVPEKFPGLNFVFLEAGLSWVPYMMFRLNKEYSMRRSEAPLLTRSPEEYIRDSFYFASQPLGEPNEPDHLHQILGIIGAENIMFASDYPHWDFDHPDALDKHLRAHLDAEQREQVLRQTPVEAFGLEG